MSDPVHLVRKIFPMEPSSDWLATTSVCGNINWTEVPERLEAIGVNPDLLIIHKLQADVIASRHRVVSQNQNESKKRAYEEIKTINFFKAYEFGLGAIHDHGFTQKLLRELHAKLVSGHTFQNQSTVPGQFRTKPVWAGKIGCNISNAHVVYINPIDISPYLKAWVRQANDRKTWKDDFTRIAWCYRQLIGIHPFSDGNGRLARLIVALMLQRHSSHSGHHLLLNGQIEADRRGHHNALEGSFRKSDPETWINYLGSIVLTTIRQDREFIEYASTCVSKARELLIGLNLNQVIQKDILHRVFTQPLIPLGSAKEALNPEVEEKLLNASFLERRGDILVHPPWFQILYAIR